MSRIVRRVAKRVLQRALGEIESRPVTVLCLIAHLSILNASLVFAADLDLSGQYQSNYNWTGMYFGAAAGYKQARGTAVISANGLSAFAPQGFDGLMGSAHAGYNWQIPNGWGRGTLVIGLEFDVSGSADKGTHSTSVGAELFSEALANSWLSTLRGRVGVPVGPSGAFLIYGIGGFGFGRFQSTATVSGPVSGVMDGTSGRAVWSIGVGTEYGITRDWSWRLEYLYLETGAITDITPVLSQGISLNTGRITENLLRTGISWHY